MKLTTQLACAYTPLELADLFNRSFEGYFMPVNFSEEVFLTFIQRDGVDLDASRVLLDENQPAGLALIASRGTVSRLAAMGIVSGLRGQNAGSWLMPHLLDEARQRGEIRMVLEVIAQNKPGIRLYEKFGFTKIRRLLGYVVENPVGEEDINLKPCALAEVSKAIEEHSLPDMPWQMDALTLGRMPTLTFAFRLGEAYIAITDPLADHIAIRSLALGEQEDAIRLLKTLFALNPGKTWHVPAVFPEELGYIFENAGMKPEELSQWQMGCGL